MRKLLHLFTALAAVAMLSLPAAPALAFSFKTYVSNNTGNDANLCVAPAAPCLTLAGALSKTQDKGEIDCLDSSVLSGNVTIGKSVTIDCGIQGSFTGVISVNAPGIVVVLRNLSTNGGEIDFINGAELDIENCLLQNSPGFALYFEPTTPGSQLSVINSIFLHNGTLPSNGAAILISPQSGGTAGFVFDHVTFGLNVNALRLDSSAGGMGGFFKNSTVRASAHSGIIAYGGGTINLNIQNSSLTNNVGYALSSLGAGSVVRISDSDINSNDGGVSTASGGSVLSYKNNRISGNNVDGTPLPAVPGNLQ